MSVGGARAAVGTARHSAGECERRWDGGVLSGERKQRGCGVLSGGSVSGGSASSSKDGSVLSGGGVSSGEDGGTLSGGGCEQWQGRQGAQWGKREWQGRGVLGAPYVAVKCRCTRADRARDYLRSTRPNRARPGL
jgi:hypothetical protein